MGGKQDDGRWILQLPHCQYSGEMELLSIPFRCLVCRHKSSLGLRNCDNKICKNCGGWLQFLRLFLNLPGYTELMRPSNDEVGIGVAEK
jgi:hypothetical protein